MVTMLVQVNLLCDLVLKFSKVVQKIVECVKSQRTAFVQAFQGNVYELAIHPYGCRVLQRCLEYMGIEQMRPIVDETHRYSGDLMQNKFGVSLQISGGDSI